MIFAGINILLLSAFLLIVGLCKPKWILFWMDKPSRYAIVMMVSVLVIISITLFGEGTRQKQIELEKEKKQLKNNESVPVIATESPKVAPEVVPEVVSEVVSEVTLKKDEVEAIVAP